MSRIAGGEHLLGGKQKTVFRNMLRKQAFFCGVEVLTYAIMSNHFHLLIRVVPQEKLSDTELVQRVRVLYGEQDAKVIQADLQDENDEKKANAIRKRLLTRMGDVSIFLKELKQRFSIWYNKNHERFGTLWAERFKSVLIEGEREVLVRVAAYIDLNAVRAGVCEDPIDYRYCGYSEAVAGGREAREGLKRIYGVDDWKGVQEAYRLVLFGVGYHTELGKGRIKEGALREVWEKQGHLSLSDALRCRIRHFSDGMALGRKDFVNALFSEIKETYWRRRKAGAKPMAGSDWKGLCTLNRMRGKTFG